MRIGKEQLGQTQSWFLCYHVFQQLIWWWLCPYLITTFWKQSTSDRILPRKDIGYGRSASNTMSMETSRQSNSKLMHDEVCRSYLLLHQQRVMKSPFWMTRRDSICIPIPFWFAPSRLPSANCRCFLSSDVPSFLSTSSTSESSTTPLKVS